MEAAGPSARGAISEHRPRAPHRRTGAGCVAESWNAATSASASVSGAEGGGLFPGGGGARPPSRRRGGRSKPFSAPSPRPLLLLLRWGQRRWLAIRRGRRTCTGARLEARRGGEGDDGGVDDTAGRTRRRQRPVEGPRSGMRDLRCNVDGERLGVPGRPADSPP